MNPIFKDKKAIEITNFPDFFQVSNLTLNLLARKILQEF